MTSTSAVPSATGSKEPAVEPFGLILKLTDGTLAPVPVTALADLPGRPCPIAAALKTVGDRWALLVVREIALGSVRFSDIVRGTGAPRDRIAARLEALGSAGVIDRVLYQSAPPRHEYRLTESGRALLPVLDALLVWGNDHAVDPGDPNKPSYSSVDDFHRNQAPPAGGRAQVDSVTL